MLTIENNGGGGRRDDVVEAAAIALVKIFGEQACAVAERQHAMCGESSEIWAAVAARLRIQARGRHLRIVR
jgi:hypothetical protein